MPSEKRRDQQPDDNKQAKVKLDDLSAKDQGTDYTGGVKAFPVEDVKSLFSADSYDFLDPKG